MLRWALVIACALYLTACLQGERILGNVPEGTVPAATVGAETGSLSTTFRSSPRTASPCATG